jgi:Tfp pilus assembly protein PilF
MQAERLNILLKFLEEEPHEPFNQYAVAMEYLRTNKAKSIELLQNLIKKHPEYLASYYPLAALYVENEQFEAAIETYQRGILLAESLKNTKTLKELKGAYQMLLDELE